MTMRLEISIGPVQGFVSQSRRTRDLWGSSYLLSFLSAHAMYGAQKAGGKIIRPIVDEDPLFLWVADGLKSKAPLIGSTPNHFILETEKDAQLVALAGTEALENVWNQVCDSVWKCFVSDVCPFGNGTELIWNRQISKFWEVIWTAGPSGNHGSLLPRRKHWRSHRPPDEPGDKCTVMHDMQELSGYIRAENSTNRKKQDQFWESVRQNQYLGVLDLQDTERLCAVAFVKRLFPKVKESRWQIDASHWPSTRYVASVPWIRKVIKAAPQLARKYAETVKKDSKDALHEQQPPFTSIEVKAAGDFAKLDANYLDISLVKNERLCPLNSVADRSIRDELGRQLKDIYLYPIDDGTRHQLGPPPMFYALLLADGDRLGELLSKQKNEGDVGHALTGFTRQVQAVVKEHNGVTVYAGGDDVLAMLPVQEAFSCAAKLSSNYRSVFPEYLPATLSAAIVFAHVKLPLKTVLDEAHRLLDEIAKKSNGRDSLASGVMKSSTLYCQWVTTWARRFADGDRCALELLDSLVTRLRTSSAEPGLSSSLVYRIRETLTILCGWNRWYPGSFGRFPAGFDIRALLRAEIVHSLAVRMDKGIETRADEITDLIWNLLGPSRNTPPDDPNNACSAITEAGIDVLLLARFLAGLELGEDFG